MTRRLTEKGYLLLTALAEGENHGYALAQRVDAITGGEVTLGAGTLYATLDRLLHDGLIVESGEEVVDGRSRRNYRIAPAGRHAVAARLEQLQRRVSAMTAVLRTA